jgi:hypothetical protein
MAAAAEISRQNEGIFTKISEIQEGNHDHLKEIKSRISTLVKKKIDALNFEEKLKSSSNSDWLKMCNAMLRPSPISTIKSMKTMPRKISKYTTK